MFDPTLRDPRSRQYLVPTRVVWQSTGESTPENAEVLLTGGTGQASVWHSRACRMEHKGGGGGEGGEAPGVLVDFGREIYGGVQLVVGNTSGNKPVPVRIRFGESVSEAMAQPVNDHGMHDTAVDAATMAPYYVAWAGSQEVGSTGFRFVRLDLTQPGTFIELQSLRAVALFHDLPYKGSFRCSDQRLNDIWSTGAYTVHLCMQDYLWDGIKRDRLIWAGDIHPETRVVSAVFGEAAVVEKSLDLAAYDFPLPGFMNNMEPYSLWWLIAQRDWYFHHGNLDYLRQHADYIAGVVDLALTLVDASGSEAVKGARFLDWSVTGDAAAVHAGLQGLFVMAFKAGADVAEAMELPAVKRKCLDAIARMKAHTPGPTKIKQARALMAIAGLEDARAANAESLAVEPLRGLSTFYGYYVLQARAMAGDYAGALDVIRRYWGAMLDLGGTTLWEHFDIDWLKDNPAGVDQLVPDGRRDIHRDYGAHCFVGYRHSLCHGWAAGPTAWLTEHVLGVSPAKAGCRAVRIKPHLADLRWAKGTFPTPAGIISIEHERRADGTVETSVDAPDEIDILRE